MIFIDFEARSFAKLSPNQVSVGTVNYVRHESTQPLSACYAFDDGGIHRWAPWTGHESLAVRVALRKDIGGRVDFSCPPDLRERVLEGEPLCAHNATFDRTFWLDLLTKWYGWPRTPIEQWVCSSATARYNCLSAGLDDVCLFLGLPGKADNTALKKLYAPRPQWMNSRKGTPWNFDAETYQEMVRYNVGDVRAMRAAMRLMFPLTPSERALWLADQEINLTGVPVDRELVDEASRRSDIFKSEIAKEVQRLTDGKVPTQNHRDKLLAWIRRHIVIKDLTAGEIKYCLKHNERAPKHVLRVLELRQLGGGNAQAKYKAIPRLATGDRVYNAFYYYGSHTGRASAKGVQLQNAVRPKLDADTVGPMIEPFKRGKDIDGHELKDVLDSMVRCSVAALPGHVLVSNDLAQIEARGTMWLAGETTALERFAAGVDQYKITASVIFNKPVSEITSTERGIGKATFLGCGFGMQAPRFQESLYEKGIEVPLELAEKSVAAFRRLFPKVPKMWWKIDQLVKDLLRTRKDQNFKGKVFFSLTKLGPHDTMAVTLPSGRTLYYPSIRLEEAYGRNGTYERIAYSGYRKQVWVDEIFTKGSAVTENGVQAFSRDILMTALLRIHRWLKETKYGELVMHVHDELVAHVLERFAEIVLKRMAWEMEKVLPWAKGIPLASEGWVGKFYRKE